MQEEDLGLSTTKADWVGQVPQKASKIPQNRANLDLNLAEESSANNIPTQAGKGFSDQEVPETTKFVPPPPPFPYPQTSILEPPWTALLNKIRTRIPVYPTDLILAHYDFLDFIGQGGFGSVFKVIRKSDRLTFSVKLLKWDLNVFREAEILSSLSHKHVVKVFEIYVGPETIFIVQEYCPLQFPDIILSLKNSEIKHVMVQLLQGIDYLHSQCVVHRDIKPQNILFQIQGGQLVVKIIDLGLAIRESPHKPMYSAAGTNMYLAPEIISSHYTNKVDIWSAGIVALFLCNKQLPFRGTNQRLILQQIISFNFNSVKFEKSVDASLIIVIKALLSQDPIQRPTASQAIEMLTKFC